MPKKTKRQKLIADIRRRTPYSPSVSPSIARDIKIETPVFQLRTVVSAKKQESIRDDAAELRVVKTDLYRTVLFSFIIICFEIGVYWFLRVR